MWVGWIIAQSGRPISSVRLSTGRRGGHTTLQQRREKAPTLSLILRYKKFLDIVFAGRKNSKRPIQASEWGEIHTWIKGFGYVVFYLFRSLPKRTRTTSWFFGSPISVFVWSWLLLNSFFSSQVPCLEDSGLFLFFLPTWFPSLGVAPPKKKKTILSCQWVFFSNRWGVPYWTEWPWILAHLLMFLHLIPWKDT